jgi:hypothetical protein
LVKAPAGQVLLDPVFSPDGRAIVYVRMDAGGSRIHRYDIESGADVQLLEWPGIILTPVFHPQDSTLIFVADRNGVYNLYRMPADQPAPPVALTHMLGGIFSPDFSPDGKHLAAVAYDSHGYYLTVLNYDVLEPSHELPTLGEQWTSLPANLQAKGAAESSPAPDSISGAPYRSWSHVGLDYWSPWLTADSYGVQGGLTAAFSDPTRFHHLQLVGGAASHYGTPIGALVYRYSGIYPLITLYGQTLPVYYPDLVQDTAGAYYDYAEEALTGGLALTIPWPRVDWQADLTIGYEATRRTVIDRSARKYEGRILQTGSLFEGQESSLWARLAFFNATAFGRSHSLEDGRYVTAVADWADESLGGDIDRTRFRGDWLEYIGVPGLKNHVLKLEGVYARGSGDRTRQGFFGLGAFGIPPFPDQGLGRNIGLRGYPANYQVGDEAVKAGLAYRFPIFRFYKNAGPTSPFYFHQIFGEVFYEGGRIKDRAMPERQNEWIQSVGLEVNFSTTMLRFLPVAAGVGMAYAFDYEDRLRVDEADENNKLQIYLSIKTVVNF